VILKYIAKRGGCERCPIKAASTSGRERRVQHDVNADADMKALLGGVVYQAASSRATLD